MRNVLIKLIRGGDSGSLFQAVQCHSLDLLSAGISSRALGSPPIPIPTPKSRITASKQPEQHFWDTSRDQSQIFPQIQADFPSVSLLCFEFPLFFPNPPKIGSKLPCFPQGSDLLRGFISGGPWVAFRSRRVAQQDLGFAAPRGHSLPFPEWIHGNLERHMGLP